MVQQQPKDRAHLLGVNIVKYIFILGEQVYITNCITHSVTPGPLDWAAIMTWVRPRQIDFRTLAGHETWQSLGNLHQLTKQEITSLSHLLHSDT